MNIASKSNFFPLTALVIAIAAFSGCSQKDSLNYPANDERKVQRVSCVNDLKQIGVAFRIWSGDNHDQYPFNLSTNAGGTLELCAVGNDGFDSNTFLHFQVMSNELSNCRITVCPQDRSKNVAIDWQSLSPSNVTYRLRSGTNSIEAHSHEILAVCPVDGNILYCNGEVKESKAK